MLLPSLVQVLESISGSVVPLAMFQWKGLVSIVYNWNITYMLYILSLFAYNEYILSFKEHPVKFLRTVPVQCTLYFTHILVKTGRPYIIVSWVHWGRPPWETINPGQNSSLTSPQALPGLYPLPRQLHPICHCTYILHLFLLSPNSYMCIVTYKHSARLIKVS